MLEPQIKLQSKQQFPHNYSKNQLIRSHQTSSLLSLDLIQNFIPNL